MSQAMTRVLKRFYRQERRKGFPREEAIARVQARHNRLSRAFALMEAGAPTGHSMEALLP